MNITSPCRAALRLQHVKSKHEQPPHGRFGKALFIITGSHSASGRVDVPTLMENLEMSGIDWKFLKRHGNSIAFFLKPYQIITSVMAIHCSKV